MLRYFKIAKWMQIQPVTDKICENLVQFWAAFTKHHLNQRLFFDFELKLQAWVDIGERSSFLHLP